MYNYKIEQIKKQIKLAYGDQNGLKDRLLWFKTNEPVELENVSECLELVGQYNNFEPDRVTKVLYKYFSNGWRFYIAREASPAIYVEPANWDDLYATYNLPEIREEALADEFHLYRGQLRFWWD